MSVYDGDGNVQWDKLTYSARTFYQRPGTRRAKFWILVFTICYGALALIGLGVSIAYGVPYWPSSSDPYAYGWLMGLLNFVPIWIIYLAAATYDNALLDLIAMSICGAAWLVNFVLELLQLVGGFTGSLNLNTGINAFSLGLLSVILVFNTVPLFGLLYKVLGTWRLDDQLHDAFLSKPSAERALLWGMAFTLMLGVWALLALQGALMLDLPAWPATTFGYGYIYGILNDVVWILFIIAIVLRYGELIKAALLFSLLTVVINLLVFILQIVAIITDLVNLAGLTGLFGVIATLGPLIFSFVIFGCFCWLGIGIGIGLAGAASPSSKNK